MKVQVEKKIVVVVDDVTVEKMFNPTCYRVTSKDDAFAAFSKEQLESLSAAIDVMFREEDYDE